MQAQTAQDGDGDSDATVDDTDDVPDSPRLSAGDWLARLLNEPREGDVDDAIRRIITYNADADVRARYLRCSPRLVLMSPRAMQLDDVGKACSVVSAFLAAAHRSRTPSEPALPSSLATSITQPLERIRTPLPSLHPDLILTWRNGCIVSEPFLSALFPIRQRIRTLALRTSHSPNPHLGTIIDALLARLLVFLRCLNPSSPEVEVERALEVAMRLPSTWEALKEQISSGEADLAVRFASVALVFCACCARTTTRPEAEAEAAAASHSVVIVNGGPRGAGVDVGLGAGAGVGVDDEVLSVDVVASCISSLGPVHEIPLMIRSYLTVLYCVRPLPVQPSFYHPDIIG